MSSAIYTKHVKLRTEGSRFGMYYNKIIDFTQQASIDNNNQDDSHKNEHILKVRPTINIQPVY